MSISLLYFLTGQLMWGLLPAFWRLLGDLSPLYILAARILFAALLGYVIIAALGKREMIHSAMKNPPLMGRLLTASVIVTANWGLYIYAVNTGHILQTSLAYFMNPIVCLALSSLLFKESLGPWQKASLTTALMGMAASMILFGGIPWLSLAICFTFSGYSLTKKKVALDGDVSVFFESLFMTIPSAAFVLWSEMNHTGAAGVLSGWEWLLLPATGLFTALPLMFFSAGIRGISFASASILMYMAPSIQTFIGFLYGETMSPIILINFCFILVAVVFFIIGTLRHTKEMNEKIRASVRKDA